MDAKSKSEYIRKAILLGFTYEEAAESLKPKKLNPRVEAFPKGECTMGYPWSQLEDIMEPELFAEFSKWMNGQTCSICDGRRYSHEDKQYYPDECADNPHGGVAYTWDVHRFLELIPGKEIWD